MWSAYGCFDSLTTTASEDNAVWSTYPKYVLSYGIKHLVHLLCYGIKQSKCEYKSSLQICINITTRSSLFQVLVQNSHVENWSQSIMKYPARDPVIQKCWRVHGFNTFFKLISELQVCTIVTWFPISYSAKPVLSSKFCLIPRVDAYVAIYNASAKSVNGNFSVVGRWVHTTGLDES